MKDKKISTKDHEERRRDTKNDRKNMDAQDAQDNQDATMLHKRLTPAIIACGFAGV